MTRDSAGAQGDFIHDTNACALVSDRYTPDGTHPLHHRKKIIKDDKDECGRRILALIYLWHLFALLSVQRKNFFSARFFTNSGIWASVNVGSKVINGPIKILLTFLTLSASDFNEDYIIILENIVIYSITQKIISTFLIEQNKSNSTGR